MDFKKFIQKLLAKAEINEESIRKTSGNKKLIYNLLTVFLIGVIILLAASFFKTTSSGTLKSITEVADKNKKNVEQQEVNKEKQTYEMQVQDKLKSTLEKIDGVGIVEVMINFESGEEQVPAVNINDATNTSEEKDTEGGVRTSTQKNNGSQVVVTNDGSKSEPLIVKTYKPKVTGVCIVAEGAENKVTELRIARAVINLFSIAENKVNVYPMKK